jgi:hypothetical protein
MPDVYSESAEFADSDDDGLLELIKASGIDLGGLDITQDPVKIGEGATANGADATALGVNAAADGDRSVAVGEDTTEDQADRFSMGDRDISMADARSLLYVDDPGQQKLLDATVTATPAAGTLQAFGVSMDGTRLINFQAEADGAGGIQNPLVNIPVSLAVAGDTTRVDDVVTGDITIEDGAQVEQFRFDATANPIVADFHSNYVSNFGLTDGEVLSFNDQMSERYDSGNDDYRVQDQVNSADRMALDRTTGDLSIDGAITEGATL